MPILSALLRLLGCAGSYFFPALRVRGIEILGVSIGHGRASSAESEQLATAALLEVFVLTIGLHLLSMVHLVEVLGRATHVTLHPSAGHKAPVGRDGEVTMAAVATVINGIGVEMLGYMEQSFLVKV